MMSSGHVMLSPNLLLSRALIKIHLLPYIVILMSVHIFDADFSTHISNTHDSSDEQEEYFCFLFV